MWSIKGVRGFLVAHPHFDEPGTWTAAISSPRGITDGTSFTVLENLAIPEVGQPAPPSETRTLANFELTEITTDPDPDPSFYELTVAEAVGNGTPSVIVFATPAFCQTATCGPTMDIVKSAAAARPDIEVVHVEVFENIDSEGAGALIEVPAVTEWGLPSEPWVFVVDGHGLISDRFEGALSVDTDEGNRPRWFGLSGPLCPPRQLAETAFSRCQSVLVVRTWIPRLPAMSMRPETRRFAMSRRLVSTVSTTALLLLTSSCSLIGNEDAPLSAINPKGPFAQQIDDLFWPVFWIAVGVFVLVQGGIIFSIIAFRDRPGRAEPKQVHGNTKLEITWTVIPALILAAISIPTVRTVFDLTECGDDAMTVNIIGHQWWFEYDYPDLGIETANVLVMPVDQEVCAIMTSADVLHNFWIPALNGKRYLVPGQETLLRLQADDAGEFWGQCAEFCGLSHALMRARAQALDPDDWAAWVADQQQAAVVPDEGTPAFEGLQLYQNLCASCHTVNYGEGNDFTNVRSDDLFRGPNLTHFSSRNVFAGASLPIDGQTYQESLEMWLANPPEVKPGSFMPNLGLTQDDIDKLTAWLGTLK